MSFLVLETTGLLNLNLLEHGLGESVVLKLSEKIQGLYCQVYIDNFFNSPLLQWKLLQQNIQSAGTVRTN